MNLGASNNKRVLRQRGEIVLVCGVCAEKVARASLMTSAGVTCTAKLSLGKLGGEEGSDDENDDSCHLNLCWINSLKRTCCRARNRCYLTLGGWVDGLLDNFFSPTGCLLEVLVKKVYPLKFIV